MKKLAAIRSASFTIVGVWVGAGVGIYGAAAHPDMAAIPVCATVATVIICFCFFYLVASLRDAP